jgi:hypothetical protein
MPGRRGPLRKPPGAALACKQKMPILRWERIMRLLTYALIAFSVLAGAVAPAGAFDAKSYFQQLERNLP